MKKVENLYLCSYLKICLPNEFWCCLKYLCLILWFGISNKQTKLQMCMFYLKIVDFVQFWQMSCLYCPVGILA